MNQPEIEPGLRPQLHYFLMILVWVLVAATIGLYFLFVAWDVWRPHVIWWLLSTGAIGLTTILALIPLAGRFWHRMHRNWAVAVFMLTVTPLIWFAAFTWSLVTVANDRGDLRLTLPVRAFGLWCTSYFELEARWRHPRLTAGELVDLFDDGNLAGVDQMVAEMEDHIRDMLATLEQPPPRWKTAWVRGSLFDQDGRAVGLWAICKTAEDKNELLYLDRHEVAHTLITSLCGVDVDMPMLLAEGWAQSQSTDRSRQVLSLLEQKELGSAKSLMELTSPENYGRSVSPAYSHGGPLTHYLLERFGGARFFRLYRDVRRPTFEEDVRRILGVSWQAIDRDFWIWLESQHKPAIEELRSSGEWIEPVVVRRPEDEPLWDQILAENRKFESGWSFPEKLGIEVTGEGSPLPFRTQIVIESESDSAWILTEYPEKNFSNEAILLTPDRQAYLLRSEDGTFIHDPERIANGGSPRAEIQLLQKEWLHMNRLSSAFLMELDSLPTGSSDIQTTIESIQPGETASDPWNLTLSTTWPQQPEPEGSVQIKIDPTGGFNILQMTTQYSDNTALFIEYQMGDLFENGKRMVVSRRIFSEQPESNNSSIATIRSLTPEKISEIKTRVESAVANTAPPLPEDGVDWNGWFVNPLSIAIAWPALALLILGIDQIGERVKIRVASPNTDSIESA